MGHVDGKKCKFFLYTTPLFACIHSTSTLYYSPCLLTITVFPFIYTPSQLTLSAISTPKPTSTPPSQATEIPSSSSHITEEKEEKVENAHKEPKIQEKEEEKEKVNERGKIVITGLEGEGGFGVCRPGDEECGGF